LGYVTKRFKRRPYGTDRRSRTVKEKYRVLVANLKVERLAVIRRNLGQDDW
jgi:hypothetical protein